MSQSDKMRYLPRLEPDRRTNGTCRFLSLRWIERYLSGMPRPFLTELCAWKTCFQVKVNQRPRKRWYLPRLEPDRQTNGTCRFLSLRRIEGCQSGRTPAIFDEVVRLENVLPSQGQPTPLKTPVSPLPGARSANKQHLPIPLIATDRRVLIRKTSSSLS